MTLTAPIHRQSRTEGTATAVHQLDARGIATPVDHPALTRYRRVPAGVPCAGGYVLVGRGLSKRSTVGQHASGCSMSG